MKYSKSIQIVTIVAVALIAIELFTIRYHLSLMNLSTQVTVDVPVAVPLDDVYIHCRYAQNLLAGNGYTFNPGPMVTADTSPLWVLLLALGGLVTKHLELVAIVLSIVFYLLTVFGTYRLSRLLGLNDYCVFTIVTLTLGSGRLFWTAISGMEVSLACAIVVWSLSTYFNGKTVWTALLLGFGIALRPELWFLVGIIGVDQIFRLKRREVTPAVFARDVAIFTILVLPVLALPYMERGSLLFHSSIVQGARFSLIPNWSYLVFVAKILFMTVIPPFVVGIGGWYSYRHDVRYRIIGAFAFGLPLFLAFIAPQFRHHGRYFFSVIPLVIILGCALIAAMQTKFAAKHQLGKFWRSNVPYQILFIPAAIVFAYWFGISEYAATNIAEQHLAAAQWIKTHAKPEEVIASHDVGAIGYFTDRPVIDLVGLVTPEVYPLMHDQRKVWEYARAKGANIFVIYNRLNPTFYEFAKDSLVLQTSFRVEPLVSSADTVMSIYRVKEYAAH